MQSKYRLIETKKTVKFNGDSFEVTHSFKIYTHHTKVREHGTKYHLFHDTDMSKTQHCAVSEGHSRGYPQFLFLSSVHALIHTESYLTFIL